MEDIGWLLCLENRCRDQTDIEIIKFEQCLWLTLHLKPSVHQMIAKDTHFQQIKVLDAFAKRFNVLRNICHLMRVK